MKTKRLNIAMSDQLYDKIQEGAKKHKMPMAAFARAALARFLLGSQKDKHLPGYITIDMDDNAFIFDWEEADKK